MAGYIHDAEDEFEEDAHGEYDYEEYIPTQAEIAQVYSGVGEAIAAQLDDAEVVYTLQNSPTVEAAILYLKKQEEKRVKAEAAKAAKAAKQVTPQKTPQKTPQSSREASKNSPTPSRHTSAESPSLSRTGSAEAKGKPKPKNHAKEAQVVPVANVAGVSHWSMSDELEALRLDGEAAAMEPTTPMELPEEFDEEDDEHSGKPRINLVFIGHVDAGKSTLNGQLLYLAGHVDKRTMHKYDKQSKEIGKGSFALAWVMDGNTEERARGVTMDVGMTHFYTESKRVVLLDAPGHRDFVPNMISGAAQADAAVLVVDASPGEFESGFQAAGQTREHALLVRSLGVAQLIVAINKLDTADWAQYRYEDIKDSILPFLKSAGFRVADITFVPCSGFRGENLIERKEENLKAWYDGPTLIQAIDALRPPPRATELPLRLCVADVYKCMKLGLAVGGKVEAGVVSVGDKVVLMPGSHPAVVKGIEVESRFRRVAHAGDNISLGLSGTEATMLGCGSVVCDPSHPVPVVDRAILQILTFDIRVPMTLGCQCVLYTQSAHETATVVRMIGLLSKTTGEVEKKNPRCILKNTPALIEVKLQRPMCLERFRDCKGLGRVTLRDGGTTLAAGTVSDVR